MTTTAIINQLHDMAARLLPLSLDESARLSGLAMEVERLLEGRGDLAEQVAREGIVVPFRGRK